VLGEGGKVSRSTSERRSKEGQPERAEKKKTDLSAGEKRVFDGVKPDEITHYPPLGPQGVKTRT